MKTEEELVIVVTISALRNTLKHYAEKSIVSGRAKWRPPFSRPSISENAPVADSVPSGLSECVSWRCVHSATSGSGHRKNINCNEGSSEGMGSPRTHDTFVLRIYMKESALIYFKQLI